MTYGYAVVNEANADGRQAESVVYRDRLDAEHQARKLRRRLGTRDINVYELTSPGVLYVLSEEDVFQVARDKRIGQKRVRARMDAIQKGIEDGFHDWYDVVETAIDLALEDR